MYHKYFLYCNTFLKNYTKIKNGVWISTQKTALKKNTEHQLTRCPRARIVPCSLPDWVLRSSLKNMLFYVYSSAF